MPRSPLRVSPWNLNTCVDLICIWVRWGVFERALIACIHSQRVCYGICLLWAGSVHLSHLWSWWFFCHRPACVIALIPPLNTRFNRSPKSYKHSLKAFFFILSNCTELTFNSHIQIILIIISQLVCSARSHAFPRVSVMFQALTWSLTGFYLHLRHGGKKGQPFSTVPSSLPSTLNGIQIPSERGWTRDVLFIVAVAEWKKKKFAVFVCGRFMWLLAWLKITETNMMGTFLAIVSHVVFGAVLRGKRPRVEAEGTFNSKQYFITGINLEWNLENLSAGLLGEHFLWSAAHLRMKIYLWAIFNNSFFHIDILRKSFITMVRLVRFQSFQEKQPWTQDWTAHPSPVLIMGCLCKAAGDPSCSWSHRHMSALSSPLTRPSELPLNALLER